MILADFFGRNWRPAFAATSLGLWLLALALPGYANMQVTWLNPTPHQTWTVNGLYCLTLGALAPVFIGPLGSWGLPIVAWYANPFWVWNLVRLSFRHTVHALVALGGAVLSITALQSFYMYTEVGSAPLATPRVAAYLWVAAIWLPLVAAGIDVARMRMHQT